MVMWTLIINGTTTSVMYKWLKLFPEEPYRATVPRPRPHPCPAHTRTRARLVVWPSCAPPISRGSLSYRDRDVLLGVPQCARPLPLSCFFVWGYFPQTENHCVSRYCFFQSIEILGIFFTVLTMRVL